MNELENVRQWVEAGKQIGKKLSYTDKGQVHWVAIAVQKIGLIYLLYIDDILEFNMADEKSEREECLLLNSLEEIINIIPNEFNVSINELKPCNGQKIFNPKFYV